MIGESKEVNNVTSNYLGLFGLGDTRTRHVFLICPLRETPKCLITETSIPWCTSSFSSSGLSDLSLPLPEGPFRVNTFSGHRGLSKNTTVPLYLLSVTLGGIHV